MFLEYGLNRHGEMIHIDQANRGLGELLCPYCSGQLIARKGREKVHHFAHAGETCREVAERAAIKLPYYDKFDLGLSPLVIKLLVEQHERKSWNREEEKLLISHGLAKKGFSPYHHLRSTVELTPLGKIPIGQATLKAFAEIQQEKILARHKSLSDEILSHWTGIQASNEAINKYPVHAFYRERELFIERMNNQIEKYNQLLPNSIADLNIYRAQMSRVFSSSLYFLEIKHTGGILYKIGITNRSIEERIEELKRDLAPHLLGVQISVLRQLKHRGSIEFYFKHRYKDHRHTLGSLTEYFIFEDRKPILADISKLGDYAPDDFILSILNGEPSEAEKYLEQEKQRLIEEERQKLIEEQRKAAREAKRAATKDGMQRAAAQGVHIGRPKDEAAVIMEKYPQIVAALEEGRAIKAIARETGAAINTVKKVRAAMEQQSES